MYRYLSKGLRERHRLRIPREVYQWGSVLRWLLLDSRCLLRLNSLRQYLRQGLTLNSLLLKGKAVLSLMLRGRKTLSSIVLMTSSRWKRLGQRSWLTLSLMKHSS
jgi:hypothetical protein